MLPDWGSLGVLLEDILLVVVAAWYWYSRASKIMSGIHGFSAEYLQILTSAPAEDGFLELVVSDSVEMRAEDWGQSKVLNELLPPRQSCADKSPLDGTVFERSQ